MGRAGLEALVREIDWQLFLDCWSPGNSYFRYLEGMVVPGIAMAIDEERKKKKKKTRCYMELWIMMKVFERGRKEEQMIVMRKTWYFFLSTNYDLNCVLYRHSLDGSKLPVASSANFHPIPAGKGKNHEIRNPLVTQTKKGHENVISTFPVLPIMELDASDNSPVRDQRIRKKEK